MRLLLFLAFAALGALAHGFRNREQALTLRPAQHAWVRSNRAALDLSAETAENDYAFPAAYDFGQSKSSTEPTDAYPIPTATISDDESSLHLPPTSTAGSSTGTTKPRSQISDVSEIDSLSTATLNSALSPLFDSSQGPVSQTDDHRDETVTVTVTNVISEHSSYTATDSVSSSPAPTTSSEASDGDITVVTLTSLRTITLSIGHNSSTTSSQSLTSSTAISTPLSSSGISVITITRTETYANLSSTVSESASQSSSKDITTSTIDLPSPKSPTVPFPTSSDLSSATGSTTISPVSSVATSFASNFSVVTQTVVQNITLTLSEVSHTESRETGATSTEMPTYPASNNGTKPVSSTEDLSTLYPLPTATGGLNTTSSAANATAAETTVSISTQVITITVYPTSLETASPTNGTSSVTIHGTGSSSTMYLPPYPVSNSSSSAISTAGGLTAASNGPFTTGRPDGWSTGFSTGSANSTVLGTLLNVTTTWVSTCDHTTSQPTITTGTGAANSSSSAGVSSNETATYPISTTFRTTFSPTSSTDEDSTSAYPSPSGKRLPGSPSYPWGGSGPLHRLQEPGF